MTSKLLEVAKEVFSSIPDYSGKIRKQAAVEKDQDWQRVNSLLADILKDMSMVYAKLARLQGDFAADELEKLEEVSEHVMGVSELFAAFLKAFHKGEVNMAIHKPYGATAGEPAVPASGVAPTPSSTPAPAVAPVPEPESFDKEIEEEEGEEFEGFEEEEEEKEKEGEKEEEEEEEEE